MKKYFAIILILLFAFLPAFAQFEEDETQQPAPQPQYTAPQTFQSGSVSGIVVCPNDKDESKLDPVAGAQIIIENSSNSAISRSDGTFYIPGLPYGDYKITAKKEGFYPDEKIVSLSAPSASITMTISSTKEKTVKTKPGKNITGSKSSSGMVFVAFASPANPKNQAVASRAGDIGDIMSMDPMQIEAAIAAGTDPLSIGAGVKPKYPHSYDPMVPSTSYQNSIMLFDTKTPAKSTYINLQSQVYWMVYNPANKLLYISSQSQMILVYDPGKNEVIGGLGVNGQITDMCLNNDGSLLYVAVMGKPNAILTLDCYKNKFVNKKNVVPARPAAIVTSIDGKTFYFAMGTPSSGVIYAVNAESGAKTGEVKVGNNPNGLCMRPDGKELYVSNLNGASVSVIDPAALTVTAVVPVGIEPFKMAASKDNNKIYVVCRKGNRIDVIDTTSHAVSKSVKTGDCPTGIAINGDGSRVFVTNNESRTVSIIDTKNDNVIQTTMAQPRSQPWGIAVK